MTEHSHDIANDNQRMEALITQLSAYIEQYHGGWVKMVSYEDDVLTVEMGGACAGCALTEMTLHGWIAGTVRQFFPDIKDVVATNA